MTTSIFTKLEKELLEIKPKNLAPLFEDDLNQLSSFFLGIANNKLYSNDLDQIKEMKFVLNNTTELFLDDNMDKILKNDSLPWEEFYTISELLLHTDEKKYLEKTVYLETKTEILNFPVVNADLSEEKQINYKNYLKKYPFPRINQKELLEKIVKILESKRNELSMDFRTYSILKDQSYRYSHFPLSAILSGLGSIFDLKKEDKKFEFLKGKYDFIVKINEQRYPLYLKLSISGFTVNQEQKILFSDIIRVIEDEWISAKDKKIDYYRSKLLEEQEIETKLLAEAKALNKNYYSRDITDIDYDLEGKLKLLKTIDWMQNSLDLKGIIFVSEDNFKLREKILHELLNDYYIINPQGTIHYSISLIGPRIINEPNWGWYEIDDMYPQENYDQDIVFVDHPFVKFTDFRVGSSYADEIDNDKITVARDTTKEEVNKKVQNFLEKFNYIEEPVRGMYIIENKFTVELEQWVNDRKNEIDLGKSIEYLFPLISENNFIDKIDELKALGETIIAESTKLKTAILTLQNPEFDFPRLKNIVRNLFQRSGEREFDRNQIVDSWIKEFNRMDTQNTYAESYLRKNIINPRLTNIIKKLDSKEIQDNELSIIRVKTPGRAKILLKWDGDQ